jgi:two-component system nitrate/nitrite response regulator NarL
VTITVLIADDDPEFRSALAAVLERAPGLELVAAAENAAEAIELARRLHPTVAVVDVRMDGAGGPCVARALKQFAPDVRVLALSAYDDRGTVLEMLEAGATGYMLKGWASARELVLAIERTAGGEEVLSLESPEPLRDEGARPRKATVTRPPIRVLVADNHPLYREAVATAIRRAPGLDLVAEESDGRQALDTLREIEPDVALLDMRMPELDGMKILNALVREGLRTRVIFLSAHTDGVTVYAALGAGASGYLSKDAPGEAVCDAVVVVAGGGTVLPPEVQGAIAGEIRSRVADERPRLTQREQEVLKLIADGCSAPEMAKRLNLSQGTVKSHLQSLYQRLGVSDRAAAVAEAMRRGLLE